MHQTRAPPHQKKEQKIKIDQDSEFKKLETTANKQEKQKRGNNRKEKGGTEKTKEKQKL